MKLRKGNCVEDTEQYKRDDVSYKLIREETQLGLGIYSEIIQSQSHYLRNLGAGGKALTQEEPLAKRLSQSSHRCHTGLLHQLPLPDVSTLY